MKNKPIKIIDRNFNFLGEIDDYEALIFARSWSGIGSFELHINANKINTDQLQKENIIFLNEKKAGVILHREIDTNNNEQLIIKGHTLKTYIGRKITIPPDGISYDYKNDFAEDVIKHYVNVNCVNPQDIKRKINKLSIAPDQSRGSNIKYQTRLKNLAEEIAKISEVSGLGWNVYLDLTNKQFLFEVNEGRNLTSSQDILPPAIFSIDYDNIGSQRLIDSKINYRNVAYIGGQGEGAERSIEVIGDEVEDLDRYEVFIDARDIEDDTRLADRGLQKLKEYDEIITFDNDILTQSNLVYEKDFDLGDIVTAVNKKWNITLDSRITEITEIYESSGFKINAVFGNNIPTLIDKIKQELDGPLVEKGLLEKGELGPQGPKGDTGPQGERGIQGLQGPQGIQGQQGLKGDTGSIGLTGSIGPKGDKGDHGIPGIQGLKGDQGEKGLQGLQGLKGDKGDIGAKGSKGDQGLSAYEVWLSEGNAGTIEDYLASLKGKDANSNPECITFRQEIFTVQPGQTIFTLTKGYYTPNTNSIFWYIDGIKQISEALIEVSPTSFKIVGDLFEGTNILVEYIETINVTVGLKGDKGDTGAKGATGSQGTIGLTGAKGDTGERGLQGIQGIKGDKGDQGIQGPIGATGIKGDTGSIGPKGDKGDAGVQGIQGLKGDSPIWHFINSTGVPINSLGTIGDWAINTAGQTYEKTGSILWTARANIRGPEGIQGIQGPTGAKGDTGSTGLQGIQGNTGLKGDTGAQGTKGDKGDTGLTGAKGDQGIQGLKGDIGPQGPQGEKGEPGAAVADSVEWTKILNKPTNLETTTGSQAKATTAETNAKDHANALSAFNIADTRTVNSPPSFYQTRKIFNEFKSLSILGLPSVGGTYCTLITDGRWTGSSGGQVNQTVYTDSGRIFVRVSTSTTVWGAWKELATIDSIGTKIITSATEPSGLATGDQWHKEI